MKKSKTPEAILKEDITETIYFALTRWDMNPMTKGFSKELTKEIMSIVKERVGYFL